MTDIQCKQMIGTQKSSEIAATASIAARPLTVLNTFVTPKQIRVELEKHSQGGISVFWIVFSLFIIAVVLLASLSFMRQLYSRGTLPVASASLQMPRALNTREIEMFSVTHYTTEESDLLIGGDGSQVCSVCLEEFHSREKIRTLRCGHVFHVVCIDQWLTLKGSCPLCIRSFTDAIV